MKLNLVDARGRSCPEPVLITKKALELNSEGIQIIVDNGAARDNIKRFAGNLNYNIEVKEEGQDFVLTLKK